MGCQHKHHPHISLGSVLLSCRILLSSVGKIWLTPIFIVQCIQCSSHGCQCSAMLHLLLYIVKWQLTVCLISLKPIQIGLCMLMSLSIHLHVLYLDTQYGQTWHLSTQLCSGERSCRRLLWSTVTDHTIRQPGFDLPHHTWSLMNLFWTGQGPCRANLHKWGLAQSPSCDCDQQQTMNHIVDTCPLTKVIWL